MTNASSLFSFLFFFIKLLELLVLVVVVFFFLLFWVFPLLGPTFPVPRFLFDEALFFFIHFFAIAFSRNNHPQWILVISTLNDYKKKN